MAKPLKRQVLEGARELIRDPNAWAQGDYCGYDFDEDNNKTNWAFCLIGAIRHAAGIDQDGVSIRAIESTLPMHVRQAELAVALAIDDDDLPAGGLARGLCPRDVVTDYNDNDERTHEEVLAILDKALARL